MANMNLNGPHQLSFEDINKVVTARRTGCFRSWVQGQRWRILCKLRRTLGRRCARAPP